MWCTVHQTTNQQPRQRLGGRMLVTRVPKRIWHQLGERRLTRCVVRLDRSISSHGLDLDTEYATPVQVNESEPAPAPAPETQPKIVRKLIVGLGNPGKQFELTRHNIGQDVVDHFVSSYASKVAGKPLAFHDDKSLHGKIAYFHLPFQQHASHREFVYPHDDLIDASSARRKQRTISNGVAHDLVNVAALQPTTYMNHSGQSVRLFLQKHRWRLKRNPSSLNFQDEMLVVTDDVAAPFGTCRFRIKGGSGGQNGIKDIIKNAGTERFVRLKIGVGQPQWFANGESGAPAGFDMAQFVLGRFNGQQDQLPALLAFATQLLRLYLHRGVTEASSFANGTTLYDWLKTIKHHQS